MAAIRNSIVNEELQNDLKSIVIAIGDVFSRGTTPRSVPLYPLIEGRPVYARVSCRARRTRVRNMVCASLCQTISPLKSMSRPCIIEIINSHLNCICAVVRLQTPTLARGLVNVAGEVLESFLEDRNE